MVDVVHRVGHRVREERTRRGLSRKRLAELSGVSQRFLGDLEAGRGNISIRRLADVARPLDLSLARLVSDHEPRAWALLDRLSSLDPGDLDRVEQHLDGLGVSPRGSGEVLALLGVRGAGKSTVGREVADRLGWAFVELDARVEEAAGLSLAQLFSIHGEPYYRQVEHEVLGTLLGSASQTVVATGGSLVTHSEAWGLLRRRAHTVWLRADAQDHWERVIAQGDRRPMERNPQAFSQLESLLAERAPLYRQASGIVETSGRSVADVVADVLERMGP
jgi:XRE family aerobic/anaerobic benzoate catabolism transcriptional regulator